MSRLERPPLGRSTLCAMVFLLAAGCGQGPSSPSWDLAKDPAGRALYFQTRTADGGTTGVQRIDGDVEDAVSRRLWGEEDQTVVVTGSCPGSDQHKVIAFSPDGRRLAEWTPSRDNPFDFLQYQHPVPWSLRVLDLGERRFLTAFTKGIFFPSSFVMVEVGPDRKLTERLVVWNPGVLNQFAVEGETLAIVGLNNALQVVEGKVEPRTKGSSYPLAVAIVDLASLLAGPADVARRVEFPAAPGGDGHGYRFYYLLPVLDSKWDSQGPVVRMEGGRLKASLACGLTFEVDVATGKHRFGCTAAYRTAHESDRKPGSPGIEEHLGELDASVHSWVGANR